jgi:hypothetical protein
MKITLNTKNAEQLAKRPDADEFVNSVLATYLTDGFIRRSEVAGMVVTKPYFRSSFQTKQSYDETTLQFEGVVVEGIRPSESLFVSSPALFELLRDHQVVLVMQSPRSKKPEMKRPSEASAPPQHQELS